MSTPAPLDFVESDFPPGLSVIEASAGTGKTYAISHLVPRLLLDGTVGSLGEILLVTFTNDAARELSDRVRRVLEKLASPAEPGEQDSDEGLHTLRVSFPEERHQAILRQALADIDLLNVSTIHSFCQRTIQAEGTLCGLPVMPEVITDANDLIGEALHDLWQEKIAPDPLMASLASNGNWSVWDDIGFVQKAFPMEDFEPAPEARPFERTLEEIRCAPGKFTVEIRGGLDEFIKSVGAWNDGGGDAALRANHLQALSDARLFSDPGFWDALVWIAGLDQHINGRTKAGKASKAQAAALPAVLLSREIANLLARLRWNWQNACVRTVRDTVRSALHASRRTTQDGLILTLRDALRSPKKEALTGRLRARYKVALIDESQDTDPKQFEIFKNIFIGFEGEPRQADHRLVMIGDPKQAIYGFRGADVNTYLEAKNQARKVFTLGTTYRSPQPLVSAINAFFARPGSLLKEGLEFHPAESGIKMGTPLLIDGNPCDARVEAWIVPDANAEDYRTSHGRRGRIIATVASEIVRLLKSGSLKDDAQNSRPVEPRDFAVLTSSNAEAQLMAAALKNRGVPAIVASGADVLGTEEAMDLLRILRAVNEPRRSGLRHAALATRLLGHDSSSIHAIRMDAAKDDETLLKFLKWQAAWERKGITAAISLMDADENITARMAASVSGERRVTNFRQLSDLLQAAAQEHSNRPGHLLRWLSQEITRAEDSGAADERQIQLESDRDAVQVVTMHKAKGLEYNLVFAPFLWSSREPKGINPLAGAGGGRKDRLVNLDLEQDPAIHSTLRQCVLEDRLRLAYVAMTRAKVRLWIYGGEMGNSRGQIPASPLDWILRGDAAGTMSPVEFDAWADAAKSPGRGDRHAAGIQSLFAGGNAALIHQKPPPASTEERWNPVAPVDAASLVALPPPAIGGVWSVTSFSALTREKNPHGSKDPAPAPSAAKPEDASRPSDVGANPFINAPGGTLIGTAIHAWLERWDFDEPDPAAVRDHLGKFSLRSADDGLAAPLDESVLAMLKELRGATLPGLGCTVAEACPSHEASEWHFHLPIKETLGPHRLAAAFARHAAPEHRAYAPMLEVLQSQDLQGFLQGFMDRLAFHQNAWGVIDWKTNRLGEGADSYSQESMLSCAMQSHYLLQAHLYLVALRRYLKRVSPHARLAGAWLVFLRAVRAGDSAGILHINPAEEFLDALDGLFYEGKQPPMLT